MREHVGASARKKRTLRRTLVEICGGADSPEPTQNQRAHFRSHVVDATPTESMRSNTSRMMKVCGNQCREVPGNQTARDR